MQTLIILGRQPALGKAELESLYGADKLKSIGDVAVAIDLPPTEINFARLGGMVKFCKILTTLDTTNWRNIQTFLEQAVPAHAKNLDEGKLTLGLSAYDIKTSPKQLLATGLTLKKLVKKDGRSTRLVPNSENELNSAQVLHNGLTRKLGWELVFVRDGTKTIVAQTIAVQDIDAYVARDRERPARDARVGMLPPKLAQTIINLGVGRSTLDDRQNILDPFCGTGVLLQEALLMGYEASGTDLEPRMIEYTNKNLAWLSSKFQIPNSKFMTKVGDATSARWQNFDSIACETYLGRPLTSLPDQETLNKIIQDCNTIHKKFLQNITRQTKPGFRMCIAVPAWRTKSGFKHLPTLDHLEELGYTRMSFVHATNNELIYHREGQVVARELVVLIRK